MGPVISIASAVRFAQPWWLLALGAVCIPPVVAAAASRRGRHALRFGVAFQCAAVAMVALALARPEATLGERAGTPYLVLRDVSASVRSQQQLLPWPGHLPRENVEFASTVSSGVAQAALLPTQAAPVLRLAAARRGEIAGVVIVTDGQFHDDWQAAASELGRAGKPVAIVPLDSPPADARIAQMTARRHVQGPAVDLQITVTSGAAQSRLLTVERRRPAKTFPPRLLNMHAGDTAGVSITDEDPPADRLAVYVATLGDPADAFPENDSCSAAVFPTRPVVAWLAGAGYRRAGLESALAQGGVQVRAVGPSEAQADASGWADYAGVILVEPGPGEEPLLSPAQRRSLAEYVRAGGGLLQIGSGPHRTPGDRDDPVNRIAALAANPYERKPLKVIVVLDASGSMSEPAERGAPGTIRFDLAAEAVMALQRHLTKDDALAVITFSGAPQLIYDSGAGTIDFGGLHQALKGIRPGGTTKVFPALEQAVKVPVPSHLDGLLIVVSDLLTERFDPRQAAGLFSGRRLRPAIVVTNPPGGPAPAQAPLRRLAETMKAPLKVAGDLAGLADIFVEFLQDARGDPLRRGEFAAAAPGGQNAFGVDAAQLPAMKAYYLSAAQQGADVLLRVKADPVMAARPIGLGRVVSLAVPIRLNDSPEGAWARFDPLLAAAARQVIRRTGLSGYAGRLSRREGRLHVELTAHDPSRRDGQWPLVGLKLTADALAGDEHDAAAKRVPLEQMAPGVYEAKFPAGEGPVGVAVRRADGTCVWQDSLAGTYPDEFAAIGANWDNLEKLARLTGGTVSNAAALAGLAGQWDSKRFSPVWMYALAGAVVLMLVDWAAARILRRPSA